MAQKSLSIKQNMLWNSIGSIIGLGCQWLVTVFIVRLANGYHDAGTYSLAVSVYGIFYPIAQYRMKTYQVSDVKGENSPGEYLAFRFVTCGISLLLCMGYAAFTCSPDTWLAILLYGIYKIATLIIDVMHGCDQREKRMDLIGQSLALQGIASLGLFVIAYLLFHTLEISLVAMTLGVILVGIVADFPRTRAFAVLVPSISLQKTKYLLVRCLPVVLAAIAASAMPSIPRQYLSIVFGREALGIYASVAAPVAIIQMGASYIYSPLLSYFSDSYANNNRTFFYKLFFGAIAAVVLIGILCGIAVGVAGENLLVLVFGEGIRDYVYLMLPMIVLAMLTGYSWFMSEIMTALRNFRSVCIGNALSLAIVIIVLVPCVNAFGMNGATIASILAMAGGVLAMAGALFFQLKKHWH